MTARPGDPAPVDRSIAIAGGLALVLLVLLAAGLVALVLLSRSGALPGTGAPAADPAGYAYATANAAPALELTDQDGRPFSLASLLGRPVLLFFGYTHCPDVCPATVGVMNEVLASVGAGPRVVFVSIDPERDNAAAMKSYLRFLPPAYVGLSGTPDAIRRAADAWGVRYAKIETSSANGYAMAHTADVYLVDAQGRLRAHFPFGTQAATISASLDVLLAETPTPSEPPATPAPSAPPPSASPGGTPTPAAATPAPSTAGSPAPIMGDLRTTVVSASVWAGGQSPVILSITDAMGMPLGGTTAIRARVTSTVDGSSPGPDVPAVAIRPTGESVVSYVVTVDIPTPGPWRLQLTAANGATGSVSIDAMDPGTTPRLGGPAPDVRTPTLNDVGGLALAVTTAPQPDLRFSQTSTADARAAGKPYVLVVDSVRFKVSPACGRALTMARYLLDRWPEVVFIHLEPFEYSIITNEPVLGGDITNPPVNRYARAWGLGDATWPATDMPWIFVVDGSGIVRAKYTGIVGSADVDLILSLISGQGVTVGSP